MTQSEKMIVGFQNIGGMHTSRKNSHKTQKLKTNLIDTDSILNAAFLIDFIMV